MNLSPGFLTLCALMPSLLMLGVLLPLQFRSLPATKHWQAFTVLSGIALIFTMVTPFLATSPTQSQPWLLQTTLGAGLTLLVQFLGTIIGVFSSRYLEGESGQKRYLAALAGVLAAVHLLLLANHWLILIAAWALVGIALQPLLCFYRDRPFARLAAHKKFLADRLADLLLLCAAVLAWREVGSGSLSDLWLHLSRVGLSNALQASAVCLVLAVILRTALMPIHGWLIQVMEAPTPVSALLHAGVVNLGGFILIRFAPLLDQALLARSLLLIFGLGTAVLAGLVMLTRISIKVRLAWSTVAQMGFMVLECGLGLYSLAALHLIGHSLYKAHVFLSASTVVQQTRQQALRGSASPQAFSLCLAPIITCSTVLLLETLFSQGAWPWWWSGILGLAWAPMLWLSAPMSAVRALSLQAISGLLMIVALTGITLLAHALPLGLQDNPNAGLGVIALSGMALLYLCLVLLQLKPQALKNWRRRSYAGFYVDELYTRLALQLYPSNWAHKAHKASLPQNYTLTTVATQAN